MTSQNSERVVQHQVVVQAGVDAVWEAWTTEQGVKSFFAPACNLYEIFFDPDAEPGKRGADGMRILALQPQNMLSFTWNAPLHLPSVREQLTHVVIRLRTLQAGQTQVTLTHDGWGEGQEWDAALAYLVRAWGEVVLPRLQHRFSVGPVDWDNPPAR